MRYYRFMRELLEYGPVIVCILLCRSYITLLYSPCRYLRSKYAEKHQQAEHPEGMLLHFHNRVQK